MYTKGGGMIVALTMKNHATARNMLLEKSCHTYMS